MEVADVVESGVRLLRNYVEHKKLRSIREFIYLDERYFRVEKLCIPEKLMAQGMSKQRRPMANGILLAELLFLSVISWRGEQR